MMRDSKSSEKKPIKEVQTPRPRKPKLERIRRNTTERKKAEEVLRSGRDKIISILEAVADGVYIANQKYDIEYVNPVLEKDFGAWKGRKCYEYFHDRKESCSWCKNKDVFAGKTVHREWYFLKNQKTYDLVDTPLKNADGSISKLQILRDVTERKRMEEVLKASELRFRSLIEQTTDAVFCYEYDPPIPTDLPSRKQIKLLYNGLLVECNDVCAKSYGARRAEEVIGKRLTELFKTTPGSLDKLFTALIDGGYHIVDGEGVEKLKDGTERYYLNNGHGIIEDSKLVRVWGTFRDITERKKMEEQLKQSMEFLANTINALDDTFFVKDEEHRWAALNDAACEAIGRPREELIGKSDYDFFPKEQADKFWEKDNLVLETGETNVSEEEVTWLGKVHTISTKKSLFTDFITGKRFIVGTARDITERKRAENAVWENERFLNNIFNAIQDGISVLDPDLNIVRVNPWMVKMYADKMPLIGKKCYMAYQNSKNICPWCPSVRAIETGQTQTEIVPYPYSDKPTGWIELSSFPLKDASGKVTGVIEYVKDITERKKAEEALQESEQKYRALVEQLLHGIVILQDFRVVFANKAAAEIVGLTMEELLTLSLEDMMAFIPPENRAATRERLKNRFAGKNEPGNYELRLVRRNGEEFWLNLFFSNIEYQGKFAIQLAFTDITEKKRMVETLRASEASYRELADSITDIFFAMDKNLRYTYWNTASEKLTGIPAKHAIGKSIFDVFPDTEATRKAVGIYQEVLKTQQPHSFMNEYRLKGKDFSFEINAYPSRQGLSVFAKDITERLQAQKQLKQSKEFLDNAINAIDDPFFAKDEEHRWTVLNDAACEVMGRSREELIGKTDYDLFAKEQADVFWERDNLVLKNGVTDVNEEEITWHGKSHIISTKKSVFTDSITGKKFIVGTIRDITDRKKAEEALRDSEQRYRATFEQAADSIVLIDVESGELVEFNDRAHKNLGYTREEFRNLKMPDFDAIESAEETRKHLEKIIRTGADTFETKHRTKKGEIRDIQVSSRAISIHDKDFVQSIWYDITERKKAEETLTESEEKFRNLAEQSPNMIFINKRGRVVYANKKCEEVMGYKREEFYHPDFDFMTLIAPEYTQLIKSNLDRHMEGEEVDHYEYGLITKNGEKLDAIITTKLIKYEGENSILGTITDITERKKAQQEIAKLAKFPSEDPNPILRISKDGTILYANDASSIVLDTWDRKIGECLPKACCERVEEVFSSGTASTFEFHCHNGQTFEVKLAPIVESGYANAYGLDITERKQAEEKLREYQEQLKSLASQLTLAEERERRRIATELHDEISQLLFISKMKLETLHKSASDKKYDDTLDEINNSLGRIMAAMRSLTFDLSSPILYEFGFEEAVAEWLNERVEKKYGIATEFEDDGLRKPLDDDIRVLLFRNVRELLINVVKHAHASKVKVSIGKVDGRIRVSVEDDGVGFESAKAESMITSKEAFGLFSIRERLEHFGGRLEIKSAPGCGCRVTITSPLKREVIKKDKQK